MVQSHEGWKETSPFPVGEPLRTASVWNCDEPLSNPPVTDPEEPSDI